MSSSKDKKKRLSDIAFHIKNAHNFLIKIFWYLFGFYYGGSLRAKYQIWFAKKIKFKPKNLTILNSLTFSFIGGVLYFSSRGHVDLFASKYLVSWLSEVFNLAFRNVLGGYVVYNILQSLFRIIYAETTKKAISSFNLLGASANLIHWVALNFHKNVIKKNFR